MTTNPFANFAAAIPTTAQAPAAPAPSAPPVVAAPVPMPTQNPYAGEYSDLDSLEVKAGFASRPMAQPDGREARYILGVKRFIRKKVKNQKGGTSVLKEMTCVVLASDGPNAVGSEVALTFWEGSGFDDGDVGLKKCVLALENVHHRSPIGHYVEAALSQANTFAGKVFGVFVGTRKEKYVTYRTFPAACVGGTADAPVFDAVQSNLGL